MTARFARMSARGLDRLAGPVDQTAQAQFQFELCRW